jgi:ComF family protein
MYQTFVKPLFADIKTFVLDTLFPISCLSCGEEGDFTQHHFSEDNKIPATNSSACGISINEQNSSKSGAGFICADCKSVMKTLEHQRCIVCQKNTPFGATHPLCQTPWGADALISFYDYHDEKVSKIIIAGKYNFIPMAYEILGQMVAKALSTHYPLLTTHYSLVPIPLHNTRHRWRGFNQAEVLCQAIGKELGLPISHALTRNKITKTQKDLKKEARQKNITNAFCIAPSPSRRFDEASAKLDEGRAGERLQIQGQSFILIDDVTTTGATLQEAAKILKRSGAAKVICLTVARD